MKNISCRVALLAVVVAGCGGESKNGGAFSSGLPNDAKVASLSDGDVATLCRNTLAYYAQDPTVENELCGLAGVVGAEVDVAFESIPDDQTLRQTCHDEDAKCRTTIETPDGGLDTCELASPACTATIGDYEACFDDTIAALGPALAKLPSCDTLTLANVATPDSTPKQPAPASCQKFEAECPGGFAALRFESSGAASSKLPDVDLDGGAAP